MGQDHAQQQGLTQVELARSVGWYPGSRRSAFGQHVRKDGLGRQHDCGPGARRSPGNACPRSRTRRTRGARQCPNLRRASEPCSGSCPHGFAVSSPAGHEAYLGCVEQHARVTADLDGGDGYDVDQRLRTDQVVPAHRWCRPGIWSRRLSPLTACSFRVPTRKRAWLPGCPHGSVLGAGKCVHPAQGSDIGSGFSGPEHEAREAAQVWLDSAQPPADQATGHWMHRIHEMHGAGKRLRTSWIRPQYRARHYASQEGQAHPWRR
jgi:hypothetical protein